MLEIGRISWIISFIRWTRFVRKTLSCLWEESEQPNFWLDIWQGFSVLSFGERLRNGRIVLQSFAVSVYGLSHLSSITSLCTHLLAWDATNGNRHVWYHAWLLWLSGDCSLTTIGFFSLLDFCKGSGFAASTSKLVTGLCQIVEAQMSELCPTGHYNQTCSEIFCDAIFCDLLKCMSSVESWSTFFC
jgi:hypothetical protein